MVRFIFALYETSVGHSLPLFIDDLSKDVMVTAPQDIFQMLLYLCLYDFMKFRKNTGVCTISCELNGDSWELHFKYSFPEDQTMADGKKKHMDHEKNAVSKTIEKVFGAAKTTPKKEQVKKKEQEEMDEEEVEEAMNGLMNPNDDLHLKTPGSFTIPSLFAEKPLSEKVSSIERLIDRILFKHLDRTKIIVQNSEIREGVVFVHKRIVLSKQFCMITDKSNIIHGTSLSQQNYQLMHNNQGPHSHGGKHHHRGHHNGHHNQYAVPPMIQPQHEKLVSDLSTPLSLSFFHDKKFETQWTIIASKLSETGIVPYLKEKLQSLYLPVVTTTLEDFITIVSNYKHHHYCGKNNYFLLPESHLTKLNVKDMEIMKAWSKGIVVVCDLSNPLFAMNIFTTSPTVSPTFPASKTSGAKVAPVDDSKTAVFMPAPVMKPVVTVSAFRSHSSDSAKVVPFHEEIPHEDEVIEEEAKATPRRLHVRSNSNSNYIYSPLTSKEEANSDSDQASTDTSNTDQNPNININNHNNNNAAANNKTDLNQECLNFVDHPDYLVLKQMITTRFDLSVGYLLKAKPTLIELLTCIRVRKKKDLFFLLI
jgi:hypothetical protein